MNKGNLSLLRKGDYRRITQVNMGESSLRLMELGLVPGVLIKVIAVSPFGDPIAIELADCCCISLRKSDACQVLVEEI